MILCTTPPARELRREKKQVQDAEEFAAGSASVSPAQESSAASDSETEFPCLGCRAVHMRGLAEGLSECQNSKCKQLLVLLDCIKEKNWAGECAEHSLQAL